MRALLNKKPTIAWLLTIGFASLAACAPVDSDETAAHSDSGVDDLETKATTVCATAEENQQVTLSCTGGATIDRIVFASYGTPSGSCSAGFSNGSCHASNSLQVVQTACVGKQSCTVRAGNDVFDDPCGGVAKRLAVTYSCGTTTPGAAMPVFLMAGQSNMVGNVDPTLFDQLLSELGSGTSSTLQSRLKDRLSNWYLNNDGGYASYGYSDAMATFESSELIRLKDAGLVGGFLKTPLSNVMCTMNSNQVSGLTTNCGNIFGPELVLGHYLKTKGNVPTSLIKVAQGGTTLASDWRSPKTVSQSGGSVGPLYTQLQSRIDSLKSNPASVHANCATGSCRWGGFIWFQGENDSMDQTSANAYAQSLKNLIADVRARVGSSTLPVVIVGIGKWGQSLDFGATVAAAQRSVVAADANTRLVKTDDLSGYYHYDPAAQLIIGERTGIALTAMLGGGSVDNCPNDPNKTEPGQCGCGVAEGTCGGGGSEICVKAKENATASLSCPSGQVINTLSFASYGTPTGACPNVAQGTCHASTSLSKVKSLCLNKQSCSVGANNDVFGDPCSGVGKTLAVKFTCSGGTVDNCPNDPNKTEPGQCGCGVPEGTCSGTAKCTEANENANASLSCASGQVIQAISFASYGAPTGTCPNVTQGSCHASSSFSKVQSACLNKQSCTVGANNDVFGDPCSGTAKKLSVKYVCSGSTVDNCPNDPNKTEPGQCGCGVPEGSCNTTAKCTQAKENETTSLSCSNGQVIQSISFASYGAPTGTCPNVAQGSCNDPNSLSKVQALCLNKFSCSIAANNEVFEDTCGGISKSFAAKYVCGNVNPGPIEKAMTALTNHLKGTPTLSAAQIAAQKAIIDNNLAGLSAGSNTFTTAFNLVATYESVIGPLFMNAANSDLVGWNPGFDRKALKNDIHMAVLDVMQGMIDYSFTLRNVSQYESAFNGRKFRTSEYFPGKVTSTPNPSVVHTATIKGDYPKTWGRPVMNDSVPWARRPTGTYLAPGSIATVTVPQSIVGKGFQIRVGAHVEDYSKSNDFIRRLDRVSIAYPITATVTKVANPLGGGIYIDVPYLANAGTVTVQIQNAVRSPYYSNTALRKTTLSDWQNTERNFGAPWADFQTDKFMVQMPTSWINKNPDPSVFLTFWDNAMDVVSDLMGFPRLRNKEVLYMIVDRSWRYGVGAPGYPSSNMLYLPSDEPFSGNEQNAITKGPSAVYDTDFQTELHELGHGQLFAKLLDYENESAVEILAAAVSNRKYGKSLDEAHRYAVSAPPVSPDKGSFLTLPNTAIEWMTTAHFKNGNYMSAEDGMYQLTGSAKYIQIADILGWQVLDSFWRSTNLDYEAGVSVDTSINGLILRMSKAAGVDVTPLLVFWGNMPTDVQAMKNAIAAANIPRSAKIYDRLVQYQQSVPANNSAFRTFSQNWWGRQPVGNEGEKEAYHAQLWNSYDASYAASLRSRIQNIINTYFPGGRP